MISEAALKARGRHFDSEPETRVVGIGEPFFPFQLPLRRWHGYSGFSSMNPGLCSEVLLHSRQLPDMRVVTIIQNGCFPKDSQEWNFWIEADKRDLPQDSFDPDFFQRARELRVQVAMPEGDFEASPNLTHLRQGALVFDVFRIPGNNPSGYWLKVDPQDKAHLQRIKVAFL